jgi:hypothetical protein
MKQVAANEYRAVTRQKPEEHELVQWLAAIGRPPEFNDDYRGKQGRKDWVEEKMYELGLIETNESHYHDWVIDYLDWLENARVNDYLGWLEFTT